jgi:hypothetical protein
VINRGKRKEWREKRKEWDENSLFSLLFVPSGEEERVERKEKRVRRELSFLFPHHSFLSKD